MISNSEHSLREILRGVYDAAIFRPVLAAAILVFSIVVAALEGVGLGFILPIIEVVQGSTDASNASGPVQAFAMVYRVLGVPFELQFIIGGVLSVIGLRYLSGFLSEYLTAAVRVQYVRSLRARAFDHALDAEIDYFNTKGSDELLNAIVTQTQYAGRAIHSIVRVLELILVSAAYVLIALAVAPRLMFVTGLVLGGFMYGIRRVLESGISVGERVADANEAVQTSVQAAMQGIHEVKLFRLADELRREFDAAIDQYTDARISQRRNSVAITNFNRFATAGAVFLLIYIGVEFSSLSIGGLGVFLFALFRLGPKLSTLNQVVYGLENDIPHLVRTQEFINQLESRDEGGSGRSVTAPVDRVEYDDVEFAYESGDEQVLDGVSFDVERGEFVAFVGSSGAGKSTIVSLLGRMYEPDDGDILADGVPISEFDIDGWRSRISVVRQNPYIFNDTLKSNVTVGNRDATQAELEAACETAQVTEFLDELPNGYETELGDDGVRLSGGQKQRVAIARALLKNADILVLDEATSDLDSHLESKVHSAIEMHNRDHAVIGIAHRLSTVVNADRIYMMEDGRVVESGSHEELIEYGEQYADLYANQVKGV